VMEHCHETRRRIQVALWAYAYEIADDPIVTDAVFDAVSSQIDVSIQTGNALLDKFFAEKFDASTGMWVRDHPELDKLEALYLMTRKPPHARWVRIGAEIYEYELGDKR
jgi:hypothetical protein